MFSLLGALVTQSIDPLLNILVLYNLSPILKQIFDCFVVDMVELVTIKHMFERHGFINGAADTTINCAGLYDLLCDIYKYTTREQANASSCNILAEVTMNWLLNLYDM